MILFEKVIDMININEKNISVWTDSYSITREKMSAYCDLRICFVKSGEASWNIEGNIYRITPGDIIFLGDKQKRMLYDVSDNGLRLCVMRIKRQAFLNTSHLAYFLNLIKAKKSVIKDSNLLEMLETIDKEYTMKKPDFTEMISAKITEFFITLERKIPIENVTYTKMDKNMIKVLDYIESNVTEKITLSEAAGIYGMTDSAFSRHFLKVNGISFKKYIMTKKTAYAIYLLENTDKCVTDIAYECGFSSISGFYDTFKKVTGRTPSNISSLI